MKEIIMGFWPIAFAPLVFFLIFFSGKNWATITNIMEKKYSFEEAIVAFKKGAIIYRVKGYTKYGSEVRTCNGKTKTVYGYLNDQGEVEYSASFSLEAVMADDWVIVWPNKEKE